MVKGLGVLLRWVLPGREHFKDKEIVFVREAGIDHFAFQVGEAFRHPSDDTWMRRCFGSPASGEKVPGMLLKRQSHWKLQWSAGAWRGTELAKIGPIVRKNELNADQSKTQGPQQVRLG